MAYEQKDNTGSLFKNKEKEHESHADYTGSVKVGGQEFWLNAWLKKSKAGTAYMSLSVKPKQQRAVGRPGQPQPVDDPNDPVPF